MLRTTISIRQNEDISKFYKLQALLKRYNQGYVPKKSKILELGEMEKFLKEAPNSDFLATKVKI